jgi:hypothetical protein
MRFLRIASSVVLLGFAALTLPLVARASEEQKVITVMTVKLNGDRQPYLDKIKTFQGITKRLKLPAFRVWRATLAGAGTDELSIVTEYPNVAAWADANTKLAADEEAAKFARDIEASGIRTVVDRSLLVEVTP